MVYLLDANIIIRVFVDEHIKLRKIAIDFLKEVENGDKKAFLPDMILAECYYVLTKFYKFKRVDIANDLQKILNIKHIFCNEKLALLQTLQILKEKNIDFADAYLLALSKLKNYEIMSFDKDLK